jgi:hypothetical protein
LSSRQRPVQWANAAAPFSRDELSDGTRDRLAGQMTVSSLGPEVAEFASLAGLDPDTSPAPAGPGKPEPPGPVEPVELPEPTQQLADELFVDRDWLVETGVHAGTTGEPARTNPFIEDVVLRGRGDFDLAAEVDLFATHLSAQLHGARRHDLLVADGTLANVLAYARLLLAPVGGHEIAVLAALTQFCRAWAPTYDAVFLCRDRYNERHGGDGYRAKVLTLQDDVATTLREICREVGLLLIDGPGGLSVAGRVARVPHGMTLNPEETSVASRRKIQRSWFWGIVPIPITVAHLSTRPPSAVIRIGRLVPGVAVGDADNLRTTVAVGIRRIRHRPAAPVEGPRAGGRRGGQQPGRANQGPLNQSRVRCPSVHRTE